DFAQAADNNFTQGALGESVCSLRNGLPQLAFFRAYTPELTGWFNDFGTSGPQDANGGIGRISTSFNAFSASPLGPPLSPLQQIASQVPAGLGQNARCPGTNERDPGDHSTPFTDNGTIACNPSQVPPGP
ncbi:MAG TPA: hypothetical protein VKG89_09355, partial [Solirubrobacterales bacterium]|nr:hypothetical protein [Solirubrobacterales bacterium]